jgi:hypothetical protein
VATPFAVRYSPFATVRDKACAAPLFKLAPQPAMPYKHRQPGTNRETMYKIIGGDQREYGPVDADELRRWIAEGRLSGQSLVQVEGSGAWRALSTYPEFAEALGAQAGATPAAGAPAPPLNAAAWSAEILARRPEVQMGSCLARSWDLLRDNFGLLLGATFLVWLVETFCQFHWLTGVVYLVLHGVFYGGLSLVFLNRLRGQPATAGEAVAGVGLGFAQLLLAGFISGLLSQLACCCLIVPGIYLFVAWLFSVPLVADKRLEFWSAMELSRRVVTRVWFEIFALFLVAFLPALLAHLFLQVKVGQAMLPALQGVFGPGAPANLRGLLEVITQAQHLVKISPALALAVRLVFLLNLPFALGALLSAYENLFGPRAAPTA